MNLTIILIAFAYFSTYFILYSFYANEYRDSSNFIGANNSSGNRDEIVIAQTTGLAAGKILSAYCVIYYHNMQNILSIGLVSLFVVIISVVMSLSYFVDIRLLFMTSCLLIAPVWAFVIRYIEKKIHAYIYVVVVSVVLAFGYKASFELGEYMLNYMDGSVMVINCAIGGCVVYLMLVGLIYIFGGWENLEGEMDRVRDCGILSHYKSEMVCMCILSGLLYSYKMIISDVNNIYHVCMGVVAALLYCFADNAKIMYMLYAMILSCAGMLLIVVFFGIHQISLVLLVNIAYFPAGILFFNALFRNLGVGMSIMAPVFVSNVFDNIFLLIATVVRKYAGVDRVDFITGYTYTVGITSMLLISYMIVCLRYRMNSIINRQDVRQSEIRQSEQDEKPVVQLSEVFII